MRRGVGVVERVRTFPKVFSVDPPPVTEDEDVDGDGDDGSENDGNGDDDDNNGQEAVDGDVVVGTADGNGEEAAVEDGSGGGNGSGGGSVSAAAVGSVVRRRGKQVKPVKKAKKLTAKQIKMEAEAVFAASRTRPEQIDASLLALPPCTSWVSLRQNIRAQVHCWCACACFFLFRRVSIFFFAEKPVLQQIVP